MDSLPVSEALLFCSDSFGLLFPFCMYLSFDRAVCLLGMLLVILARNAAVVGDMAGILGEGRGAAEGGSMEMDVGGDWREVDGVAAAAAAAVREGDCMNSPLFIRLVGIALCCFMGSFTRSLKSLFFFFKIINEMNISFLYSLSCSSICEFHLRSLN